MPIQITLIRFYDFQGISAIYIMIPKKGNKSIKKNEKKVLKKLRYFGWNVVKVVIFQLSKYFGF